MVDKRYNFDIFDLTKFVCAIMIVAIHSVLFPKLLFPWTRIAVPMFFTISSYLFFIKIKEMDAEQGRKTLWKFVKRNLVLYIIWSVFLFPITLHVKEAYFANSILEGGLKIFKEFLMGDSFLASWFIMANVIATAIVYVLSKRIRTYVLLVLTGIVYLNCCLVSGYKDVCPFAEKLYETVTPYIGDIRFNFVAALFWITLGMAFAYEKIKLQGNVQYVGLVISAILLFAESRITYELFHSKINRDCFIMLMPLCLFTFSSLLSVSNLRIPHAIFLRKCSTLMYVTHYSFIICLEKFMNIFGSYASVTSFTITTTAVLVGNFVLVWLVEKRNIKFLKYLY